jgi:hypothetical protein
MLCLIVVGLHPNPRRSCVSLQASDDFSSATLLRNNTYLGLRGISILQGEQLTLQALDKNSGWAIVINSVGVAGCVPMCALTLECCGATC